MQGKRYKEALAPGSRGMAVVFGDSDDELDDEVRSNAATVASVHRHHSVAAAAELCQPSQPFPRHHCLGHGRSNISETGMVLVSPTGALLARGSLSPPKSGSAKM